MTSFSCYGCIFTPIETQPEQTDRMARGGHHDLLGSFPPPLCPLSPPRRPALAVFLSLSPPARAGGPSRPSQQLPPPSFPPSQASCMPACSGRSSLPINPGQNAWSTGVSSRPSQQLPLPSFPPRRRALAVFLSLPPPARARGPSRPSQQLHMMPHGWIQ